jgi:hypothetical protein
MSFAESEVEAATVVVGMVRKDLELVRRMNRISGRVNRSPTRAADSVEATGSTDRPITSTKAFYASALLVQAWR